jgi:hypothetical protein
MATQVSLNDGAVASAGALAIQTNGTTQAVSISTGQVATLAKDAVIQGVTVGRGAGAVASNTAVGASALAANTSGNGSVSVGTNALAAQTSAAGNTGVGYYAGQSITTGGSNSFFGYLSGFNTSTGTSNVGLGVSALQSNTTASNNTAVGYQALYTNATGTQVAAFGYQAGYLSTGNYGAYLGNQAGYSTTGAANTFVGSGAGYYVSSGAKNTIIGGYTGNQGGLDIRTASNYIVLSDGDGNVRGYFNNSGYFFAPAVFLTVSTALSGAIFGSDDVGLFTVSASGQKRIIPRKPNDPSAASDNLIDLGDSGSRFRVIYAGTGTINTSDANEKQQIRDLNVAEKSVAIRIKSLIKAYKFNDAVALKGDNARIHIGVLAQEVASAFEAEGLDAYKYAMFCSDTWYEVNGNTIDDKNQLVTKDTPNAIARTRLGVRYDELLAFVISTL